MIDNCSSFDGRQQERGHLSGCFCREETCYILENKASIDAVGRVSPNAITSWAFIGM